VVDGARHQFFAGAALPHDQNRRCLAAPMDRRKTAVHITRCVRIRPSLKSNLYKQALLNMGVADPGPHRCARVFSRSVEQHPWERNPGWEEMTEMAHQLWCRDVFDWLYLRGQGEKIREVLAQFMAHARGALAG